MTQFVRHPPPPSQSVSREASYLIIFEANLSRTSITLITIIALLLSSLTTISFDYL